MSAEIPISEQARALCEALVSRGPVAEKVAQAALTAAREAGAREERERWYVNLYDLADRIKKGI